MEQSSGVLCRTGIERSERSTREILADSLEPFWKQINIPSSLSDCVYKGVAISSILISTGFQCDYLPLLAVSTTSFRTPTKSQLDKIGG